MKYYRAMRTLLLCLAVSFSVAAAERAPTKTELAFLAYAETTLTLDALQTLWFTDHATETVTIGRTHYTTVRYELNPILGRTPSHGVLFAYFAVATGSTAGIWYAAPSTRLWLPALVGAVESYVVVRNGITFGWKFGI